MTPALYGIAAAGIAVAGLSATVWVQTARLDGARESLAACQSMTQQLGGQIERQNASIAALEAGTKKAQERTRAAEAKAAKGLATDKSEIARLKAQVGKKRVVMECPSGAAVKTVREGLIPK